MGVLDRMTIFVGGTIANGILLLIQVRVILPFYAEGQALTPTGPATGALGLVPQAITIAIGLIQIGLIVYLIGGLGSEKTVTQTRGGLP
jgi:hypothetical protein